MLHYFDLLTQSIGQRVRMVIPRSEALEYFTRSTAHELLDVTNMRLGALMSMFSAEAVSDIEQAVEQAQIPTERLELLYKSSLDHGYPRSEQFENWLLEARSVPA